jgi:hypothetical protein
MPTAANIVLNDGTDNHTYGPDSISTGKSIFLNRAAGQSNLADSIVVERRSTPSGVSRANVNLNFTLPETNSDTGTITPVAKSQIKFETAFPANVPLAERQRIFAIAVDAMADTLLVAVARDGEALY